MIKFLPIKGTLLDLIKGYGMVATASTHLCGVTACGSQEDELGPGLRFN